MKRAISFVLTICMLVCMVPVMLPSGEAHAMFGISSGVTIPLSEIYYINDDASGGVITTGASEENYNLKIVAAESKIIMRDLNYSGEFLYIGSDMGCTIEVVGENNITAESIGIFYETTDSSKPLRISGSGVLNVSAVGKDTGLPFGLKSAGIISAADVVVAGSVTLRCHGANDITETSSFDSLSYGICATNQGDHNTSVIIKDSANVEVYGGVSLSSDCGAESYGICADKNVDVADNATLRAYSANVSTSGVNQHTRSQAICLENGDFIVDPGATVIAESQKAFATGESNANINDSAPVSAAVYAKAGNVTVDGTVEANFDGAKGQNNSGEEQGKSYGVYVNGDTLIHGTVNAGLVQAAYTGGGQSIESDCYGIYGNSVNVSGGGLEINLEDLSCAGDVYGVNCSNTFTSEWTILEITLGNADGNSTLIKSAGLARIANNGYAYLTAGNAGGDNIGIDCNGVTADSTDVHITLGTAGNNATGIKTPGAAFNTNDNYIEINTSSAAAAVGIDAASLTGRGTGGNAIDITMLGDVGTATALSTGAVTLDNYCFISNSSEAVGTGEMTAIDCSGDLNLTNGAEIFVNVGSTPGDNYGVKCREVNSENSRLETVMHSVSGTGIGTKAANINATDSLVVSSFYSYTGANFGVAKGIEASALNVTGGTLRVDMSLSGADGDNTGIVCNTFAANSVDGSITGGTGNNSYGIKAAGDVTINSADTMFTVEVGDGTNASVGIDAGGNILVSAGALFEPSTYGTAPENCRVARLSTGTFTLAEGLHWATAAGIASTNGAYTFSADENYLIASTSAIVISSPSHHSGGSGSAGTDGSKTVVKESTDGSKTTIKTDANGNLLSVEVAISEKAVADAMAKGEPMKLETSVKAAASSEEAVPVKIELPASVTPENPVAVEIPVDNMTAGTVAVIVHGDGSEEIVKTCVAGDDGVVLMFEGSETIKVIDNTKSFTDVKGNEWFAGNVAWAASREIMNGIGGGIFDAGSLTNRGMISQILFNLEGARATAAQTIIATERFGDVSSNNWFAGSIGWLIANDIAQGQGSDFGAADPVTREQLAVMYYNYANFKGFKMNARGDVAKFADSADVSSWAEEALSWAVGMGLIQGTLLDDGSIALDPQGSSTRAMVAAITQRFCEKLF